MDWTAAEPTRAPAVGLVAQPKTEAGRGQIESEKQAAGSVVTWAAGYPLMFLLAAVQVTWLLALGYLLVRLLA